MTCKSYDIPKTLVWEAWLHVKANQGAAGIDAETIERFETKLAANLYKLWNRMSSGSYFPPPVKAVPIPKKSGGVRVLGIPTVSDRIAQTAIKMWLEPQLDPLFHDDSYGYRPGKSALEAIAVTRRRCWDQDWVVEFDIRGLFDNLDHRLLMTALRKHCQESWILSLRRAVAESADANHGRAASPRATRAHAARGRRLAAAGEPVPALRVRSLLGDAASSRHSVLLRYADDAVLHCKSRRQAEYVLDRIRERFRACNLELHPGKTRIVYCKDINRTEANPDIQFTFLGYTFRPRKAVDKYGRVFVNFSPAVSRDALKAMRQTIRGWRVQLKNDKSVADLSAMLGPILRGWQQYYGHFHGSALKSVWRRVNRSLIGWLMRKHKKLAGHKTRAAETLKRLAQRQPRAFVHWSMGYLS